tara:strand:- start:1505 stop:1702 length:198 start_codon:yes stop_codon:yes gene_type:complete
MGEKEEFIYNIIAGVLFFLMVICFVRCYYYKHIYNRAERVTPINSVPKSNKVSKIIKLDNEEDFV